MQKCIGIEKHIFMSSLLLHSIDRLKTTYDKKCSSQMSKAHPFRLSLYGVIYHYKNECMWQYHSFFLFLRIDKWASIIFNEAENYISA